MAAQSGIPQQRPHEGAQPNPAVEMLAGTGGSGGIFEVLLELVGTEQVTLGQALDAWQREQERVANRSWRRPGGLARPAGL
jgi:hypothetical protein